MLPPRPFFLVLALILAALALGTARAGAQEQERKLLDRIMHPNMDLHFDGFGKGFETKASVGERQASVHPFGFGGRTATVKAGDGAFHAKAFDADRGAFHTDSFTVKRATAVDRQGLPAMDHAFETRGFAVHEDRAAGKSASVHQYVDATKPFLVPGLRQGTIDELRQQKNLTIDQVREILNKSQ